MGLADDMVGLVIGDRTVGLVIGDGMAEFDVGYEMVGLVIGDGMVGFMIGGMGEAEGGEEEGFDDDGTASVKLWLTPPTVVALVPPAVVLVALPTATMGVSGLVGAVGAEYGLVGEELGDGAELPISLLSFTLLASLSLSLGFANLAVK